MADDGRRETLRRYVAELLALESDLEAAVDRQRETVRTQTLGRRSSASTG